MPPNLLNPGNVATAAGIAALLGGNNTKTALSNAAIPNLNYINQQVPLAQAGQGQSFFTPGQYVSPGNAAFAQATAAQQAQQMTKAPVAQAPLPAANVNTAWQSRGNNQGPPP